MATPVQGNFLNEGALYTGIRIFRNTPNPANVRFLWFDDSAKELRWTNGAQTTLNFKRIALSHIKGVSRTVYHSHFGFQIDTRNHNIKFWSFSKHERETVLGCLFNALNKSVSEEFPDENELAEASNVRTMPSFVLAESNKAQKRTVLGLVSDVLGCGATDIPSSLMGVLTEKARNVSELQSQLREIDTNSELHDQIRDLEAQLECMEEDRRAYECQASSLEESRAAYQTAKTHSEGLSRQLNSLYTDKAKLSSDGKGYQAETDFLNAQNYALTQQLEKLSKSNPALCYKEILQGVNVLVKKRNSRFSPRILTLSQKLDKLVLRPVTSFSSEKEEVLFKHVTCIVPSKKTESGYEEHSLFSIHSPNLPLTIAATSLTVLNLVSSAFSLYKKKPLGQSLKSTCDTLEVQLNFQNSTVKNYKKSIIVRYIQTSICCMNEKSAQKSVYEAEINTLKELSTALTPLLTKPAEEYLATERPALLMELLRLNSNHSN